MCVGVGNGRPTGREIKQKQQPCAASGIKHRRWWNKPAFGGDPAQQRFVAVNARRIIGMHDRLEVRGEAVLRDDRQQPATPRPDHKARERLNPRQIVGRRGNAGGAKQGARVVAFNLRELRLQRLANRLAPRHVESEQGAIRHRGLGVDAERAEHRTGLSGHMRCGKPAMQITSGGIGCRSSSQLRQLGLVLAADTALTTTGSAACMAGRRSGRPGGRSLGDAHGFTRRRAREKST